MKKSQSSGTALGTAAMRAIESKKPVNKRICYDPYARQLTTTLFYYFVKLFGWYGERHTHGGLTYIVCRCRYIDEYLRDCLNAGMTQVVILGAGLDSRAYRNELQSGKVKMFEVDHPMTQAHKIQRVQKIFGALPPYVTYVSIDFTETTLDKLLDAGFQQSVKTLFIWEGVSIYLNLETVDAILTWIHTKAAMGSVIIFDFQHLPDLTSTKKPRNLLYRIVSHFSGEKREFGFSHGQIEEFLRQRGFINVVETNAAQLTQFYCTGPNQKRRPAEKYAIVHAEVGEATNF